MKSQNKENKLLKTVCVCVCVSVSICFSIETVQKKKATNEMKERKKIGIARSKKVRGKIKS